MILHRTRTELLLLGHDSASGTRHTTYDACRSFPDYRDTGGLPVRCRSTKRCLSCILVTINSKLKEQGDFARVFSQCPALAHVNLRAGDSPLRNAVEAEQPNRVWLSWFGVESKQFFFTAFREHAFVL
jgi:hypothetical protein